MIEPIRPFSPVNIDPVRRCRPFKMWPTADRQAWNLAMEPGDELDPGGVASRWSANHRLSVCHSYGRYITSWDRAHPHSLDRPLSERVTPDAVRDYVAELRSLNTPVTVAIRIGGLCCAVRAMAPHLDWRWLTLVARRLQSNAKPARVKRSRLVDADELFALGLRLMSEAASQPLHWSPALRFRDGLIIALLAARPLRVADFTGIAIGRHLVKQGDAYRLLLIDSKTKRPRDLPVPERLHPWFERYLSCYRPYLCRRVGREAPVRARREPAFHEALWVNRTGCPLAVGSLSERVEFHTKQAFGWHINPHLFRDCAATSIAFQDPEHVRITMSVLGHSRLGTSERYYNHAQASEAIRRHQANIMALRRQAPKVSAANKRDQAIDRPRR